MLELKVEDGLQESASLHLVEEFNHRVINEYTDVISTLSVAAMQATDRIAREQLVSAANRVRAFAQSHRALLPPQSPRPVDLGDYISGICERMLEASLGERGVRIELKTDDVWVPARRCWRIGLVVAELIRNSCKHGFSGGSGRILISVAQSAGEVCCRVRDNGLGKVVDVRRRGCRLMGLLAAELGGAIHWDFTPDGSTATLQVPATELIAR